MSSCRRPRHHWLLLLAASLALSIPALAQAPADDAAETDTADDESVGGDTDHNADLDPSADVFAPPDASAFEPADADTSMDASDGSDAGAEGLEPEPDSVDDSPAVVVEDTSLLDAQLDLADDDEPSLLERRIIAFVASGVSVAALGVGVVFGILAYQQYQCLSDVVECNRTLQEPIYGDAFLQARSNVEHLSLIADMAYLFAAAAALVAVTGFVRGFIFTGEQADDEQGDEQGDGAPPSDEASSAAPRVPTRSPSAWRLPTTARFDDDTRDARKAPDIQHAPPSTASTQQLRSIAEVN